MDFRSICGPYGKQIQSVKASSRYRRRYRPESEGLEQRALLAVLVSNLSGTEGFPLSGQVATFSSTDVQGSSPQASIAWGDGRTSTGTVVPQDGNLAVNGTNTYAVPGNYRVTVTITGAGTSSASGQGQAMITATVPLATGTTITPTAGQTFTGVVASFTDPYPSLSATAYRATIAWGNGITSVGTISPRGSAFDVTGSNTYAAPGSDTITVTIIRLIDNQMATTTSNAIVVAPSLIATGTTIVAVAGQSFTGTVALLSDANPQPAPAGYSVSIAWGDGQSSIGTVMAAAPGSFNVIGTHIYGAPSSSESVVVTITRLANGQSVTATSSAIVVTAPYSLSGQLNPLSDTGVSNSDGITAINQPTFNGTAVPYAIVELFSRRSDQAQPVLLGQAIADANGAWNVTVGALPDGVYTFSATEIPPTGLPTTMVSLTPGSVVIDTIPPVVVAAHSQQTSELITVVLRDYISGLNPASLMNPANYALLGLHGARIHPSTVTIVPNAMVRSTDPITVALQFSGARRIHGGRTIALGGINDLAGNRLQREYVKTSVNDPSTAGQHFRRLAARARHSQRTL
jgi:hypothetical protein